MDVDGNVHARSNDGGQKTLKHPAYVEIGTLFRAFYPTVSLPVVSLPVRNELTPVGEAPA
jgi:hypothetical protein